MADLSAIRTDAKRLLNVSSTDTAQFSDAELNSWINQWLRYTATWLKHPITEESQTSTDGTATYTITADFLEITDIYYDDAKLAAVDEDYLSARDSQWRDTDNKSTPLYYLQEDSKVFRLYPIPDAAKTILIRMRVVPTSLSDDADPPDLPTSYHDTAQWYVVAMGFFKLREFDKAKDHWNRYLHMRVDLKGGSSEFAEELNMWRWE